MERLQWSNASPPRPLHCLLSALWNLHLSILEPCSDNCSPCHWSKPQSPHLLSGFKTLALPAPLGCHRDHKGKNCANT